MLDILRVALGSKLRTLPVAFAFFAAARLFGAVFGAAAAATAPSGPFGIEPGVLTINSGAQIAELQLSSLYGRTRVFDVRVMRWTQQNGRDTLSPDQDFIVVPAVFSIDPYQTVTVRIKRRSGTQNPVEQSYKVVATGVVPGAATPPPTARQMEAKIFVPPASPAPQAGFSLKITAPGQGDLTVTNRGNAHLYLGGVSIGTAQSKLYDGTIADYVLANSSRTFHVRLAGTISDSSADLTFNDEQGRPQTDRVILTR